MPRGGLLLVTTLLVATAAARATAAVCPAAYAAGGAPPPLFGGVQEHCSSGCQARGDVWSRACAYDAATPTWGLCLPEQRAQLQAFVQQQVASGRADPSMLTFSPCDLFDMLAGGGGRTLWLVGDSHVKQLYAAARCFMTDTWSHGGGECAASPLPHMQDLLDEVSARGHPYRTPPRCLHLINGNGARICLVHSPLADQLVLPGASAGAADTQQQQQQQQQQLVGTLQVLQQSFVDPQDIIYVSVGRWHANNCEGVSPAWPGILQRIGAFVASASASMPNVFFSPSPFDHVRCFANGTLDLPSESPCVPASEGGYKLDSVWQSLLQTTRDVLGAAAGRSVQVMAGSVLHEWAVAMHWGHIRLPAGGYDCLHHCREAHPTLELWGLVQAMRARGLGPDTPQAAAGGGGNAGSSDESSSRRVCRPVAFQFVAADAVARDAFGHPLPPAFLV